MIKLEFKKDVWDEEQNKYVSPLVVSNDGNFVAIDMRAFKKYESYAAIGKALEVLQNA